MCDGNLAVETHIYYSQFTTWRNSETKVMLFYATALLCTSSTNHILVQVQHSVNIRSMHNSNWTYYGGKIVS